VSLGRLHISASNSLRSAGVAGEHLFGTESLDRYGDFEFGIRPLFYDPKNIKEWLVYWVLDALQCSTAGS